jgi:hypothetical protein
MVPPASSQKFTSVSMTTQNYRLVVLRQARVAIFGDGADEFNQFSDNRILELVVCQALA